MNCKDCIYWGIRWDKGKQGFKRPVRFCEKNGTLDDKCQEFKERDAQAHLETR